MWRARARLAVLIPVVLAAIACGQPGSLSKQADEVHSVAAEGSLLAHDASEGDTTAAFTRVHSSALRHKLKQVVAVIDDQRLLRVAHVVSRDLERLGGSPGDRKLAGELERRFEGAADEADRIGKGA